MPDAVTGMDNIIAEISLIDAVDPLAIGGEKFFINAFFLLLENFIFGD